MARVVAVLNPASSRARQAADLLRSGCAARGWPPPLVLSTTQAEPGGAQGREALAAGADLVVVGGGDGTVRAVARVLSGGGASLGILPLGTANLFARNLRLPLRPLREGVRVALDGTDRDVDLGRLSYTQLGPAGQVTREEGTFLVVVGVGHDAETVAAVAPALKRRIRWAAYVLPGLRRLPAALLPMTVRRDREGAETVRAWSLLIANCGRIPLGIDVVPGADPGNGRLDLGLVAPATPWGWGAIAVRAVTGHRHAVSGLGFREVAEVQVSLPAPITIQVDGDPHRDVIAVSAGVERGALRVRVP